MSLTPRTRELDVQHYREPSRPLPKNFTFRFRPQTHHTMIYGNNVDLRSVKDLGAVTRLTRVTYLIKKTFGYTFQHQFVIEFLLPEEQALLLGKVRILPPGTTQDVMFSPIA